MSRRALDSLTLLQAAELLLQQAQSLFTRARTDPRLDRNTVNDIGLARDDTAQARLSARQARRVTRTNLQRKITRARP
jgi:hypothetical protein